VRKPHLPDWVEHIWTELTKPPAFLKQPDRSGPPLESPQPTAPEQADVSPQVEQWRRVLQPSIRSFKKWVQEPPKLPSSAWTVAPDRPRRVTRTRARLRRRRRRAAFTAAHRQPARRPGNARRGSGGRFRTTPRSRRHRRTSRALSSRRAQSAHEQTAPPLASTAIPAAGQPDRAVEAGGNARVQPTVGVAADESLTDMRGAPHDDERATCAWLRAVFAAQVVDPTPQEGVWRVELHDGGVYLATVSVLPAQRIVFIAQAVDALRQRGFTLAPRVLRTTTGSVCPTRAGVRYVASEWLRGQPASLRTVASCAQAAKTLALLHARSRSFRAQPYEPPPQRDIHGLLHSRMRELVHMHDTLLLTDDLDPVDAVAKTHLPEAIADAEAALELVRQPAVLEDLAASEDSWGLCHLNVTSRNLIERPDATTACTHLDMMARAPRALDLAHLIRRSMQAVGAYTDETALAALAEYEQIAPCTAVEHLLLQALLTFPHRFWRLLRSYYELEAPTESDTADALRRLRACIILDRSRRSFVQRLPDIIR